MHSQFALFDGSPGIPYRGRRVAIIRCTPSSVGTNHYTIQDVIPSENENRHVSSELSQTGPSLVAATIHVKWEGATAPYQKLQWWDTGMLVNGNIPIVDCDFNEVFVPRECQYTIADDSAENCSRRVAYQKRLRKDMIDKIISGYIPHALLQPYVTPLPMPPLPLPTRLPQSLNVPATPFTSVTNRPPTPIPSYTFNPGDSDDDEDYDEDDYEPQPTYMNASAPPAPQEMQSTSQIPLFVANLIKNEAIAKSTSCPISMESFSDCKMCSLTSCYHLFESSSLATWLSTKNTCPVCKQQVTSTREF